MQASKVTLSKETQFQIANNPLLKNNMAKHRFRKAKVLEYIRSKPSGTKFTMTELMLAAGYDPDKRYASGYAFLKGLKENKTIAIESVSKFKKLVTIPGDVKSNMTADKAPYGVAKEIIEKPQTFETLKSGIVGNVTTMYTVENIIQNAKQFAWEHNSDSLRDFISSMQ